MSFKTVAELLEDRARWTTGVMARDAEDRGVSPHCKSAVRWCLVGAIERIYHGADGWITTAKPATKLAEVVRRLTGDESLTSFNDGNTHAEILAAVKEAGI